MKLPINLPYIVEDTDRHGNVRVYVRKPGSRKVRIREAPGTPSFLQAYYAALEAPTAPKQATTPDHTARTLRWLCDQYEKSSAFVDLDLDSQRQRLGVLRGCLDEPLAPGSKLLMGECPLDELEKKHIKVIVERKSDKPGAAENRIKYLRRVLRWGVEWDHLKHDPSEGIKKPKKTGDGFHQWTIEEVAQFAARHPPGTKAGLAMAILLFTGVRRSDAVRLGRANLKDGWLTLTPEKTKNSSGVILHLPVLPKLQAALEHAPTTGPTFLLTAWGKPFSAAGFGNWFRDRCDEAELPNCTAHGLRKAGASIAAENGATEKQLMAIYGWTTSKQAQHYIKNADQKKLAQAAMHLLAPG